MHQFLGSDTKSAFLYQKGDFYRTDSTLSEIPSLKPNKYRNRMKINGIAIDINAKTKNCFSNIAAMTGFGKPCILYLFTLHVWLSCECA